MTHAHVESIDRSWTTTKVVAVIVAIVTAGYLLPWAIAAVRDVRHWSVFWVNLLLGWTIVGWIIALVMSLASLRHGLCSAVLWPSATNLYPSTGHGRRRPIEIVIPEAPLKRAMVTYGLNVLWLSVIISALTAALVDLGVCVVDMGGGTTTLAARPLERDPGSTRPPLATRSSSPRARAPPGTTAR